MRSRYVPEWLTYEIEQALAAISGDQVAAKEAMVLRMAQGMAQGLPQREIFRQPGTCAKNTWHGVGDKPGWKDDPAIAHALDLATARARWWVRIKEGRAVENALNALLEVAEDAAGNVVNAIRYGQLTFHREAELVIKQASVAEVLKASTEVLDRISATTASKSTTVQMDADQFAALTQQAKERAAPIAAAAAAGWNPNNKPTDGD